MHLPLYNPMDACICIPTHILAASTQMARAFLWVSDQG